IVIAAFDPPPPPAAPPPPAPPGGSTGCSVSSYPFCWRCLDGRTLAVSRNACDLSDARTAAATPAIGGCFLYDGVCPAPACSSGAPVYAEECCAGGPGAGVTWYGVACSLDDARTAAKLDLSCTLWTDGPCTL